MFIFADRKLILHIQSGSLLAFDHRSEGMGPSPWSLLGFLAERSGIVILCDTSENNPDIVKIVEKNRGPEPP